MRGTRRSRLGLAIGMAIVMSGLMIGIVAASIPGAGNVIYGCYVKSTGSLRVIDYPHANCASWETLISWNQKGDNGPVGPQGATGAAGATGVKGDAGTGGATGSIGAVGPTGPAGAIGATGPGGTNGTAGATGPAGATGAAGATGPAGTGGSSLPARPSIGTMSVTGHGSSTIATNDPLLGFDWSLVSPRDAATGLPTGKRQHKPIVVTIHMDQAAVRLLNSVITNENLPAVQFGLIHQGETTPYMTITLTNASVASVHPLTDSGEEYDEVTFTYQTIQVTSVDGPYTTEDDWTPPLV
jgi:type VI secretion system Hcp family effector